jgi:predicted methyltransferase
MLPPMSVIRTRWYLVPVSLGLIVLVTMISAAPAFEQKSAVNAGNPFTLEDFKAGDEKREPYQRATDVLKALEIVRGDRVADVGAGAGYYAMRLSEIVGPEGKVFAEDISDSAIGWLNRRVKVFDLRNVEVVKGEIENPQLPRDSLAGVLIVDSYHHFTHYQPMMEQILHALKPDGRLVIADYSLPNHRLQPRADQIKIHEVDPELVRGEIERFGFQVVKCEDPFIKRIPDVKNNRIGAADMWLMVAVRPK